MEMRNVRRSSIEVLRDVLISCNQDGSGKTRIMYGARLSYQQLMQYISSLIANGLIDKSGRHYYLTEKGKQTLKRVSRTANSTRRLNNELESGQDATAGSTVGGTRPIDSGMPPALSVPEVARLAGVRENTVRRWANSGKLVAERIKITGARRFNPEDVHKFIARRTSPF